jgi:ubiquinone/menaquinone biosynthesis C-methylase UbiE
MNHVAKTILPAAPTITAHDQYPAITREKSESLFERSAAIYIFCREKVFRDDTPRIIRALWRDAQAPAGFKLLELGCGPGFYACRLAQHFPQISVLGIDSAKQLVRYAREKARKNALRNCCFERGNVLELAQTDESFDALVASRLFTILPGRERAVAEIFRVLKSGGKCFVAEPRFAFSASIPLLTMRALARVNGHLQEYREPMTATTLSHASFRALFATQPWARIETWRLGRYQYALCEKGAAPSQQSTRECIASSIAS